MSASGNGHKSAIHLFHPPRRVVSLVPSLTESMFDLGFGEYVVGITDYCVHPAEHLTNLPRVGGTKTPHLGDILALKPDLVLVNQEENPKEVIEKLEAEKIPVWVTFPKTVRQALDVLWTLVGIYQSRTAAARLETLEMTLEWEETSQKDETHTWRYFCPIWQHIPEVNFKGDEPAWWMTFNNDTYMSDLLRFMGGENVFAGRKRLYPLEADLGMAKEEDPEGRDTRYPCVRREEVLRVNPELILLPDEPFAYNETHLELFSEVFSDTEAARRKQIWLVEGDLIMWQGTRLAKALHELPAMFANL